MPFHRDLQVVECEKEMAFAAAPDGLRCAMLDRSGNGDRIDATFPLCTSS